MRFRHLVLLAVTRASPSFQGPTLRPTRIAIWRLSTACDRVLAACLGWFSAGVRVTPDVVRELHRQWQIGVIEGELERDKPVLPVGHVLTQQERHVRERELDTGSPDRLCVCHRN
jgi:hypothetical protein